ncbi:MAG: TonB family protein, partial [Gemmatimonadota bacterium]|nr:TonB family protein [Gemmatimonadota bacterium]
AGPARPALRADTDTASGRIIGTVRDSAGNPIPGARVEVLPRFVTTTDSGGAFALHGLPRGPVILRVRRIGFAPLVSQWDLGPITLALDLRLHAFPAVLPAVRIQSRREPYDSRLAGFNLRLKQKLGQYITRADIERGHSYVMTDALQRLPGVQAYHIPGIGGTTVRFAGEQCPPLVMVDGFPAALGRFDLNIIDLSSVEGIEVYQNGASVPPALAGPYGMENCGVIAIWSRPMRPTVRANQLPPEHPLNLDSLVKADAVYTAGTVDEPVRYVQGTAAPAYPDSLFRAEVPGHVVARFVVDTAGAVEQASVNIVSATLPAFAEAVRQALRSATFTPAKVAGAKVRQLVEMPFDFHPVKPDSAVKRP